LNDNLEGKRVVVMQEGRKDVKRLSCEVSSDFRRERTSRDGEMKEIEYPTFEKGIGLSGD